MNMLIRFYKPYGVLSQFRDPTRPTLGDYIKQPGVYAAGRLDMDSEGLMLLTDDGALQARISQPRSKTLKIYWAQVEGQPDSTEFEGVRSALLEGVKLKDGLAQAVDVRRREPPDLVQRQPPVTPHRAARSSWLEVDLISGRNRQVRRMLAAVGLPVLRLLRYQIGPVNLDGLEPGESEMLPPRVTEQILSSPRRRRARGPRR